MTQSGARPRGGLARLRRIGPHDLSLLVRALAEVGRTRLDLTRRRTAIIRQRIAADLVQAVQPAIQPDRRTDFAEVAWSVAAAARLVPGATCLTQAFSAQRLLAQRGVASVVHLTVPKDAAAGFRPHAWVMGDGLILLGGSARDYAAHTWLLDYHADGSTQGATRHTADGTGEDGAGPDGAMA